MEVGPARDALITASALNPMIVRVGSVEPNNVLSPPVKMGSKTKMNATSTAVENVICVRPVNSASNLLIVRVKTVLEVDAPRPRAQTAS